jgi:hypothetical protein
MPFQVNSGSTVQNSVTAKLAERIKMTSERLQQIATYKIAIILMKKMLTNGVITNAEFRSLETNIAEKCNLSLCSIYRINA